MKAKAFFLMALLGIIALGSSPASGQEGTVTVKSAAVTNQFPEGVLFQVAAETAAPAKIQEIRLEMRVKGSNRGSYAYLEITPATAVEGKYLLRTGGAQYKPPGTLIEYYFIITDSETRTLETPAATHLYLDNRFEWSRIPSGTVEIYYYGANQTRAEFILNAAVKTIDNMGGLLGVKPGQTIRIMAYNNLADILSAQPFESKIFETELVREGIAFNEYRLLLMLADGDRADGVASHEMTHMLVHDAVEKFSQNVPAWLNEGLAEYGSVNRGTSFDAALSQAISTGQLVPLRHMQTLPGTSREILLVYGQGRAVVKFMVDTYGAEKLRGLLAAFNKGLRTDAAFESAYGFDQDGLDNAWRQSLGLPPVEPAPPQVTPAPKSVTPAPEQPAAPAQTPLKRPAFGCAGPVSR